MLAVSVSYLYAKGLPWTIACVPTGIFLWLRI